ncbi:MAG: hypothetical protein ACLQQ4_10095 [Bacteroidia bacterium]
MIVPKIKTAFSNISDWKWFVFIAILLRGPLWLYFGHLINITFPADQKLYSYFIKDDYLYFFVPVDNYFHTGTFSYMGNIPFTGRMPGYSVVYFLFRLMFSMQNATYCVIGLQFILSSISVYVLALTSYKIFENKRAFYITYFLYILAVFPGFFDFIIVPESFSVSALIFSLFFLVKYFKEGHRAKHLIFSGAFLTWTIFLREYTGLLIIAFPVVIGIYHLFVRKDKLVKALTAGTLFCLPFIIADGAWVIRNYRATSQFIPVTCALEDSYGKLYSISWSALDDMVSTWGENGAPFDVTGLAYYYRTPQAKINIHFPARIFKNTTTYNADSLVHLRQLYATFYYTKDTAIERTTQNRILELCSLYRQDYISHNQFAYYIIRPVKNLKYLMFFSGTGYLPMPSFSGCTLTEKVIKIIFTILYFFIFICSSAGILLFLIRHKPKEIILWLALISCIMIMAVLLVNIVQEPRYTVHVFMMFVLFASFFTSEMLWRKNQST